MGETVGGKPPEYRAIFEAVLKSHDLKNAPRRKAFLEYLGDQLF